MADFRTPPSEEHGGEHGSPKVEDNWLTSYGDLLTILLVFFVLIVSSSKVSSLKAEKVTEALNKDAATESSGHASIAKIHELIVKKVDDRQIHELVEVMEDESSIAVVFKDTLLFDLGETAIKPESRPVVNEIVSIFDGLPPYARIAIEGYTDDNPVSPARYQSNWHLSVMRALSVLNEFNAQGICKGNCELRGFAEYRPVLPNRDEAGSVIAENQSKNRRVVIRIF